MSGPLAGTCGLVLTQAWAGSFCTEILGFLGADIVQVEVRKRLDSWRGTFDAPLPERLMAVPTAEHPWNCNPLYNSVNLGKRCLTLDLQEPEGQSLFLDLLPRADFVAENFSPRVLGNLGLDYEALRAVRPDIILCSLSAYGNSGPWANIPGIGGTIEPTSGMSALLGYRDGPPMNSGQMYPDAAAGFNGAAAIVAALRHRDRTGEGQYIDLSMQEANLAFVGEAALEYTALGRQRPRMGNRHTTFAPHGIFPCSGHDRWIAIACETETQWNAFDRVVGRGWGAGVRFGTLAARKANEDLLEAEIAGWTRLQERDALATALVAEGVVAAPVLDAFEVAADQGLRARGVVVEVEHAEAGRWPQVASPFHFGRTPGPSPRPAPRLGEHSREILQEWLAMPVERYDDLVVRGITGEGPPP